MHPSPPPIRSPNLSQVVEQKMVDELKALRSKIKIGIVGGSDLSKQLEQLGKNGEQRTDGLLCCGGGSDTFATPPLTPLTSPLPYRSSHRL